MKNLTPSDTPLIEAKADDNKYEDGVVPKVDLVLRSRHNMAQLCRGYVTKIHNMSIVSGIQVDPNGQKKNSFHLAIHESCEVLVYSERFQLWGS